MSNRLKLCDAMNMQNNKDNNNNEYNRKICHREDPHVIKFLNISDNLKSL